MGHIQMEPNPNSYNQIRPNSMCYNSPNTNYQPSTYHHHIDQNNHSNQMQMQHQQIAITSPPHYVHFPPNPINTQNDVHRISLNEPNNTLPPNGNSYNAVTDDPMSHNLSDNNNNNNIQYQHAPQSNINMIGMQSTISHPRQFQPGFDVDGHPNIRLHRATNPQRYGMKQQQRHNSIEEHCRRLQNNNNNSSNNLVFNTHFMNNHQHHSHFDDDNNNNNNHIESTFNSSDNEFELNQPDISHESPFDFDRFTINDDINLMSQSMDPFQFQLPMQSPLPFESHELMDDGRSMMDDTFIQSN